MTTSDQESRTTHTQRVSAASPWARGFAIVAAVMMMTIGVFHALTGLTAIFRNEFYVVVADYAFQFDVTTWGWLHLVLGALVAAAGFFVLSGRVWARSVGVVLAALSLVTNFLFIPYYPVWSIVIIALDAAVIWALCVHGRDSTNG